MIYLDNAATTYQKPDKVYEKMDTVNRTLAVNTGRGSYTLAKNAAEIIDNARSGLLNIVNGMGVAEVVLTSSATLAFNEIIGGIKWTKEDVVYVSPYEHNAVMRTLELHRKNYGFSVQQLALDENLSIDMEGIRHQFSVKEPTVVIANQMSNVTGYILPVEEIFEEAKRYDALTIMDAAQSLGLLSIDMKKIQVDCIAFAGHKNLYGPFGTGGFYIRNGTKLNPYIVGGTGSDSLSLDMPEGSPGRYETGSPNIVAVAGLEAALQEITDGSIEKFYQHEKGLTDVLVAKLMKNKSIKLYIPENHIGIVAFNIIGYKSTEAGQILDEDYDIAVRTGYHCAPLIHQYLKDESYAGVVRASVGRYTTREDIEQFVKAVEEISEG